MTVLACQLPASTQLRGTSACLCCGGAQVAQLAACGPPADPSPFARAGSRVVLFPSAEYFSVALEASCWDRWSAADGAPQHCLPVLALGGLNGYDASSLLPVDGQAATRLKPPMHTRRARS